jgi:hypothetical protein
MRRFGRKVYGEDSKERPRGVRNKAPLARGEGRGSGYPLRRGTNEDN